MDKRKWNSQMRSDIDHATSSSHLEYGQHVNVINSLLDKRKIGISSETGNKIIQNVQKVESRQLSQASASRKEVANFARDGVKQLYQKQYRNAAASFVGSILNFGASAFHFPEFDVKRMSPSEKAAYSSGDLISPHRDL